MCTKAHHDSLKASSAEVWRSLVLVGTQKTDDDDGPFELELRNCDRCPSTLGRRIEVK